MAGLPSQKCLPPILLFKSLFLLTVCHPCPCHFGFLTSMSLTALPIWIVTQVYCLLGFLICISLNASSQNVFLALYCLEGESDWKGKGAALTKVPTTALFGRHYRPLVQLILNSIARINNFPRPQASLMTCWVLRTMLMRAGDLVTVQLGAGT